MMQQCTNEGKKPTKCVILDSPNLEHWTTYHTSVHDGQKSHLSVIFVMQVFFIKEIWRVALYQFIKQNKKNRVSKIFTSVQPYGPEQTRMVDLTARNSSRSTKMTFFAQGAHCLYLVLNTQEPFYWKCL